MPVSAFLLTLSTRLFQVAFVALAFFIPFGIAGVNASLALALLAWLLSLVARGPAAKGFSLHRFASSARNRFAASPRGPDPLVIASIVLVLSAVPSVLMSEDTARAVKDWKSYWQLAVCFLVGAHIARVGVREIAFWTLAASSGAACLLAFVQRAGGFDLGPIHVGAEHRVGGTLYTTTFAGVLYQMIVLHAATVVRPRLGRARRWLIVVVLSEFAALLLTMTRGAWIALFAGITGTVVALRSRALALAGVAALVVLAAFTFLYANDQGRTIAVTSMATSEPDRNVGTRLVLWDMSWEMFREHPLLGVGMGDYSIEAQARLAGRSARTTVDSHNIFLHVLATRGLLGFLPLLAYFVVLIVSLIRIMRGAEPGSRERHYAAGALGVTAAILAGSLTENNIDDSEVFVAFMFIVGLARSAVTSRATPRA